jgi:hypothetical protein
MAAREFRRKDGKTIDAWEARLLARSPPPPEAGSATRQGFTRRCLSV